MADFHHNIFYYYRGAALSNADRDVQLEDNTTKALINTIEHCSAEVGILFLRWLGVSATEKPTCLLQRASIGEGLIRLKNDRVLLTIVPSLREPVPVSGKERVSARPDAWLHGEGYAVLIESKAVGALDASQISRHSTILQAGQAVTPRTVNRTWSEIHHFFASVSPGATPKDDWLIGQFCKFLEWNNMADFSGFDGEIFQFFVEGGDRDTKRWVRSTMASFAAGVLDHLQAFHPFYEGYDAGNIKDGARHAWVAFGPKGDRYRNFAHQSVAVTPMGVEVFLNVETQQGVKRLRNLVTSAPSELADGILSLSDLRGLTFAVLERTQIQVSRYGYSPAAQIEGALFEDPSFRSNSLTFLEHLVCTIRYPELKILRKFPKQAVITGREEFVTQAYKAMEQLHPLVELINRDR